MYNNVIYIYKSRHEDIITKADKMVDFPHLRGKYLHLHSTDKECREQFIINSQEKMLMQKNKHQYVKPFYCCIDKHVTTLNKVELIVYIENT